MERWRRLGRGPQGPATIVYNRGQRDELRRKGAGYLGMFRGLGANIPGHGEVTDTALLQDVREYLLYIRDDVSRLKSSGLSSDETAATIDQYARTR